MLKAICSKQDLKEVADFYDSVKDLVADRTVLQMKNYTHHCGTSRYQHCLNVSYYNFVVCRFFGFNANEAARAGILHDLFLYDRHEHTPVEGEGWHGVGHPKVAFSNASEAFSITPLEGDMILKHMWPLSPELPKYKETFVITLVDKYCAIAEVAVYQAGIFKRGIRHVLYSIFGRYAKLQSKAALTM